MGYYYTIEYYDKILQTKRRAGSYQHPPTQLAKQFRKKPEVSKVRVVRVRR